MYTSSIQLSKIIQRLRDSTITCCAIALRNPKGCVISYISLRYKIGKAMNFPKVLQRFVESEKFAFQYLSRKRVIALPEQNLRVQEKDQQQPDLLESKLNYYVQGNQQQQKKLSHKSLDLYQKVQEVVAAKATTFSSG